jgi:tetratricopeptide (TPR) repeat protein
MSLCVITQRMLPNLEIESLLASGIKDRDKLIEYRRKLDQLNKQFFRRMRPPDEPVERARALFNWLWERKPSRYKPRGPFRLNDVIDAELSQGSWTVGNCLGLTLLYHCLLRKMGIHAGALYLENAFGRGPHVLTLLHTEGSMIDIENILPEGFDYKGHLDNPSRTTWGDKELAADIYHSFGNECFEKGELAEALENYEMAIQLNPQYEKAHLNRAILLDKLEEGKEDRTIEQ